RNHAVVEHRGRDLGILFRGFGAGRALGQLRYLSLEIGQLPERVGAYPGLGRRAAPGAINDADGHVVALVQVAGEEIAHRRKVVSRAGAAHLP
nr:hypothetical protein [Tanacetum cinerariifolium]